MLTIMSFEAFLKRYLHFFKEKKQQFLVVVLVIVILVIVVLLYFGFWRPSTTSPLVQSDEVRRGFLLKEIIENIDFDTGFLREATFRALKGYGQIDIGAEEKSRSNPFLPY